MIAMQSKLSSSKIRVYFGRISAMISLTFENVIKQMHICNKIGN